MIREMSDENHTQTRVEWGIAFWDSQPLPFISGAGGHHCSGRGKELRISRAPGRPRSITGRQGLEGVTLDDAFRLE